MGWGVIRAGKHYRVGVSVGRGSGVSVYRVSQGYWEEHNNSSLQRGDHKFEFHYVGFRASGFRAFALASPFGFRVKSSGFRVGGGSGFRVKVRSIPLIVIAS